MNWVHFPAVFHMNSSATSGNASRGFIWINASAGLIGLKLHWSDSAQIYEYPLSSELIRQSSQSEEVIGQSSTSNWSEK